MQVRFVKSLGAKLFYYMGFLVILTITGITFQVRKFFIENQSDEIQDSVQVLAERIASQIESTIESWRGQLAVALPTLKDTNLESGKDMAQTFVDSNGDYLGLSLFSSKDRTSSNYILFSESFTSSKNSERFEDRDPEKVRNEIKEVSVKWLRKIAHEASRANFYVYNASSDLRLPIILTASRFDINGEATSVWAVMAVWQSSILKFLPKSRYILGFVVDKNRNIFASPIANDASSQDLSSDLWSAAQALKAPAPAGIIPEFRDKTDRRRLGGFSKLTRYGLTILVEKDVEFAYQNVQKSLISIGLWSCLFLLISVLLAFWGSSTITGSLREVADATARISGGDFQIKIPIKSHDEVGLLAQSVNYMAQEILRLLSDQVAKARLAKELETAKMVQQTFFPKKETGNPLLNISGFYQPSSECGGDLWGHFSISDHLEFVFVADAMGHGAPAALVTAMAYSSVMTLAEGYASDHKNSPDPAEILQKINLVIWEAVQGTISMTFFASIIDTKSGILIYANAGHNFPVLVAQDPKDPRVKNLKPVTKSSDFIPLSLKGTGMPLGMASDSKYKNFHLKLAPGDKLIFFTDGLIECKSPDGDSLGRKWLLEQTALTATDDSPGTAQRILDSAFSFFDTTPIDDDITLVITQISAEAAFTEEIVGARPEVSNPNPSVLAVSSAAKQFVGNGGDAETPNLGEASQPIDLTDPVIDLSLEPEDQKDAAEVLGNSGGEISTQAGSKLRLRKPRSA